MESLERIPYLMAYSLRLKTRYTLAFRSELELKVLMDNLKELSGLLPGW